MIEKESTKKNNEKKYWDKNNTKKYWRKQVKQYCREYSKKCWRLTDFFLNIFTNFNEHGTIT